MEKKYNENRVELKETTRFFEATNRDKAIEYARQKRSYLGTAYEYIKIDDGLDFVFCGFYVPA